MINIIYIYDISISFSLFYRIIIILLKFIISRN